jgi:hypothetical protein
MADAPSRLVSCLAPAQRADLHPSVRGAFPECGTIPRKVFLAPLD